jgi:hypothetical protein
MNGENSLQVTNEPVEFETYPVEIHDCNELPIILEEFIEHTPILPRQTKRCQLVIGWTWKQLDLDRLCPKVVMNNGLVCL